MVKEDTLFHLVQRLGLAAATVDLSQSRHARLHLVTQHVSVDLLAVEFIVRVGVRAWTHQRHMASQHVENLRQFIQRTLS